MRLSSIIFGAIFALAAVSPVWAMKRVEQHAFVLPDDGVVKIDTYRGAIKVMSSDTRTVQLIVSAESPHEDQSKAESALNNLDLKVSQVDGDIVITARNPSETGVRFVWEDHRKIDVRFALIVPTSCNLDLTTNDGGISVDSLSGRMRARTEIGTIFFRSIDGSVDAEAESGDVVVSRCTGPVKLKTVRGDVRIGRVGGKAQLQTVNGNIEVQTALGAVEAFTAEGDIDAGFEQVATTSEIRTKVGNITATINPTEAFSIQARSRWGKVHSKLAVDTRSGGNGRSRLKGDYNGGGPLIKINASGGHVQIKEGDSYLDG